MSIGMALCGCLLRIQRFLHISQYQINQHTHTNTHSHTHQPQFGHSKFHTTSRFSRVPVPGFRIYQTHSTGGSNVRGQCTEKRNSRRRKTRKTLDHTIESSTSYAISHVLHTVVIIDSTAHRDDDIQQLSAERNSLFVQLRENMYCNHQ